MDIIPALIAINLLVQPAHVTKAIIIASTLSENRYDEEGESQIDWNAGKANTYSSSFVTLLLKNSYGLGDAELKAWWGTATPDATQYHDNIMGGKQFQQIVDLNYVLPGDIIAIKYNSSEHGHVMVVVGLPRAIATQAVTYNSSGNNIGVWHSEPIVHETCQWSIPVIDSAKIGHQSVDDLHDSRPDGGIGYGQFRIYGYDDGKVAGHTWSRSSDHYTGQLARHLVIGRLVIGDIQ